MKGRGTLLVVDDNRNILVAVRMLLENIFAEVITLPGPNQIPSVIAGKKPDVVLLDMNFGSGVNSGNEGLFWLREIKKTDPHIQVVLFTAFADVELAVNGIKSGAADFIVKPWNNAKMVETLVNAYKLSRDKKSGLDTARSVSSEESMYWGESSEMTRLRSLVEKVSGTDANVLITGENGTGKEVLAREIHGLSARSSGPMVAVDMGAIAETLFESELFGYVSGAFTDAKSDKAGKFEIARGGTLFLDEIGNLSYALQSKLLTVLQRRSVVRVGSNREIPVDIRLICATNRDLDDMVAREQFREDLLYRINTIVIHLPALRERKEDIIPLAGIFLKKYGKMYGKPEVHFTTGAVGKLYERPWYGNIRELQHVVEKAVIMSDGLAVLPDAIETSQPKQDRRRNDITTIEEMECQLIENAMAKCSGNLSSVAEQLGISRQTLYNKIKKYGL